MKTEQILKHINEVIKHYERVLKNQRKHTQEHGANSDLIAELEDLKDYIITGEK